MRYLDLVGAPIMPYPVPDFVDGTQCPHVGGMVMLTGVFRLDIFVYSVCHATSEEPEIPDRNIPTNTGISCVSYHAIDIVAFR